MKDKKPTLEHLAIPQLQSHSQMACDLKHLAMSQLQSCSRTAREHSKRARVGDEAPNIRFPF
ncbi:hypothetical protein DMP06_02590 [Slackia equolifaciens]|uniref:Uncharacterized protein n=1 Tax=Slackia equolifaciens TaxID=498718 RepID=A0A3N0B2X9_9ACTN|nr:hypothetical protein DMP06_02590 [Slackia equolifaciens]